MSKSITINTVQGIGDIFWIYQKLSPYVDEIRLRIQCTDDKSIIQRRSLEFCTMLPKVKGVTFVKCPSLEYIKLCITRYTLDDVLRADDAQPIPYAVNKPLEIGVNLRDIDPGARVAEFVDLGLRATVPCENYLCVFVAGAKGPHVWPAHKWIEPIEQLAARLGTRRIVLIGASWDTKTQDQIHDSLRRRRFDVRSHVGTLGLPGTVDIIRRARFFLGYQSGLNVLAENYDVAQLMIYFDKLRPMMDTWPKPSSLGTRYHAMTFADDPAPVIAGLPLTAIDAGATRAPVAAD